MDTSLLWSDHDSDVCKNQWISVEQGVSIGRYACFESWWMGNEQAGEDSSENVDRLVKSKVWFRLITQPHLATRWGLPQAVGGVPANAGEGELGNGRAGMEEQEMMCGTGPQQNAILFATMVPLMINEDLTNPH